MINVIRTNLILNFYRRTMANYLGWRTVMFLGPWTSQSFKRLRFEFDQIVIGIRKPNDLKEDCKELVTYGLGFSIGRMYINNYFNESTRREVYMLVKEIKDSFKFNLEQLNWMDTATKYVAIEKVIL